MTPAVVPLPPPDEVRALQPVLDGVEASAAVVDADGTIVLTNRAWSAFAEANGSDPATVGAGSSYFAVCPSDDPVAHDVAEGLRSVLDGRRDGYTLEYPCHSPTEERWFRLRVVPVPGRAPRALVLHHDVSADVKALREQAREALFLQALSEPGHLPAGPDRPLAERAARTVELLSHRYAALVERSWDAQVLRRTPPASHEVLAVAEALAAEQATARDAVAVHVRALQLLERTASADRMGALSVESRVLLITVLGHLADTYRARPTG